MLRHAKILSLLILLIAFCSSTAWAQSGSADPEFEGNAGAVIINGLRIIKRQDLDFGTIAPSLTHSSTVTTFRGQNNSSSCGQYLTCLRPGNRAKFTVLGEPSRYVTISNPGSIYIYDAAGNNMLVDNFIGAGSLNDTQWLGLQRLRDSGLSRFNVGATLHIKPNQPRGDYLGSFILNFDYQ